MSDSFSPASVALIVVAAVIVIIAGIKTLISMITGQVIGMAFWLTGVDYPV